MLLSHPYYTLVLEGSVNAMSNSNERAKIVKDELTELFKHGYINKPHYKRLMQTYESYQHAKKKAIDVTQEEITAFTHSDEPLKNKQKVIIDKSTTKNDRVARPVRIKKPPEQVRERNITWLLILGVSFLLISGLVVATSSWDQMGPVLKVITLLGVSLFFLGLSGLSSRFLKIEKTAFAFLTLGSLLLPIAIIGIGYFGLFGDYLTITGDGRFLLGIICTLIPLPLYAYNAYKTKSKLFIWIFYVFLSVLVGFILAALEVPVDAFFLLIMIFNAGLLYIYHRYHKKQHRFLEAFLPELPAFAQLNLIISTLLMLFIFDEVIFYSFNILLSAMLYMVMVFVYQTKRYQFVFVVLFSYGVYLLADNSFLQNVDFFIYALMGTVYLAFAYLMRNHSFASKVFYYTSGVVTGIAFLYVTWHGLVIQGDSRSWMMLLSYLVISGTYVYLAHITSKPIFRLLAPLFFVATAIQFWFLAIEPLFPNSFVISLFILAIGLFFGIGFKNRFTYFKHIQKSTYYLSITIGFFAILVNALVLEYIETSVMLTIVGLIAIFVTLRSSNTEEKRVARWIQPISWWLALTILYGEIINHSQYYQNQLDLAFHLTIASLILLGISLIWKKGKFNTFGHTSFYTGQIGYLLAIYELTVAFEGDRNFIRPLILLIGIGVAYWLVSYTKKKALWTVVALLISGFYTSLLTSFSIYELNSFVWFMLGLPILLLVIRYLFGKYDLTIKPYFFYFAHVVLALLVAIITLSSMVNTLFLNLESNAIDPFVWLVPLVIYLYSALTSTKENQVKLYFYASLTMFIGTIVSVINHYQLMPNIPGIYDWIIALIGLVVIWLLIPTGWKKRMEWYLIPLMGLLLAITATTSIIDREWQLGVLLGLTSLTLYFLHRRKWTTYNVLPLLFTIFIIERQLIFTEEIIVWLIYSLGFITLIILGKLLYNQLWIRRKEDRPIIDWYSIMAFIFLILSLARVTNHLNIWLEVISFILLSCWFFLQANRVENKISQKVMITLGGLSCLPPYFIILNKYTLLIPELIHAELEVLPILIFIIAMINITWKDHKNIGNHIQTILLIGMTMYLISDAINHGTISDALLLGTLAIISMFAGMRYQIKSYFFIGIGTLLFNVFYQTRAYWGNMPWWSYLLFVGLLFIAIASYNEWKKDGEDNKRLGKKAKKLIARFKEWN